jgi:hypothetical protein
MNSSSRAGTGRKSAESRHGSVELRKAVPSLFNIGVSNVITYWLDRHENTFERWDCDLSTLVINSELQLIRFRVHPIGSVVTEPFEVVISHREGKWYMKADCWIEPELEYPLRPFDSEGTSLFVCSDENDQIYLHVEKAG